MADCELMLHASPMHDVGKIGIPDAILRKPGKLDLDEWAVMKTHTTLGADILRDDANDLLQLASVIAVSHHEKWDGSGYPNGLSEDAIPEAGRIVAVADVFDALISSRTYKEAWPVEMAIAYIQDNSGIHFDPAVAASFQKCLPEILAIHMTHKE
jgi:putative two-component system response regulator